MAQSARRGLSAAQKKELWERWKRDAPPGCGWE